MAEYQIHTNLAYTTGIKRVFKHGRIHSEPGVGLAKYTVDLLSDLGL